MADAWTGCYGSNYQVKGAEFVPTIKCLESLFKNVLSAVVAVIGVGLFVMLLVGGYSLLFSGGDPKKLQKAQGTITTAIVGLVIIVCAYLILKIIESFLGVSVSTFQINANP
jgi:hypothetical protein